MHKQEIASTIISYVTVCVIVLGVIILLFFVIKPAKFMAKNRDSDRLTAMMDLETSINLYLADEKNFDNLKTGLSYESRNMSNSKNSLTSISGKGWVPLNFSSVVAGVPLSILPLDPLNDSEFYYQVGVNVANKTYEINCRFEDTQTVKKYATDGGNSTEWYEIGTDLQILN